MKNDAVNQVGHLDRTTLSDRVYLELRDLLMAGKLLPKEKLSLRSVAEALGVSIMPVREAVSRLVAEGALTVSPNRAFSVPLMTRAKFIEIMTVRLSVEGFAVEQAAINCTSDDLDTITKLDKEFRSAAGRDTEMALRLNKELHFAVYAASQLPTLVSIIEVLWLKIGPVINIDLRASRRLAGGNAEKFHARLVQALRDKSPLDARNALWNDIKSSSEFILDSGQLPP